MDKKKSPNFGESFKRNIGKGILELELQQTILNHQNGNLEEAEKGYLELIKENPDDGKLNFLLGTLYLQFGKPDVSSVFLGKSISQNPSDIKAINNLGLAYQSMGRYEDAVKMFTAAINEDENYLSAYNNLGICYQLAGDYNNAVKVLKTSLLLDENDDETNYNLGAVLHNQGYVKEALEYYSKAVELNPEYIEALYNIALINISENDFINAKSNLEKANNIIPENFDVLFNLGFVNEQLNDFEKAKVFYKAAKRLNNESAELNFNLGNIYKTEKNWIKAESYYLNALKNKIDPRILNNLGFARHRQGKYEEAIINYKAAIELDKNYSDAKINLGASLLELGNIEEAVMNYNEVLNINNSDATAHFNKAIALLLSGNFSDGWKEYEWRFFTSSAHSGKGKLVKPNFLKPEWKGENLQGKTILVHDEQGAGDSIQFIRFLSILKEFGAIVIFKCRKELINLYKKFDSIDEIVELTNNCPENYDYEISLLSLPNILKIELNNVPSINSYLKVDQQKAEYWKEKLYTDKKLKIGLVWKGNANHEYDFKRSCALENFNNLLKNDDVAFYSLQLKHEDNELNNTKVVDLSNEIKSFEDTAAIISNLDLVITVDTAAAHISGALGKNTWVLLSKVPDWRWLMDRDDSPWYSSVKLFRQSQTGNWFDVFENLNNELKSLLNYDSEEFIKDFYDKKIKAFQYHVEGETEKAEKLYIELINMFSEDTELCFWLASLYKSKNDLANAIKYFEQALSINPKYYESIEALAIIYEQTKNYKKAAANYLILLDRDRNDFNLLVKTGEIYGRLREFDIAEDYLKKAYNIDKNSFDLLNILGLVLQKNNKLSEAREMFFKAEELSPLTSGIYLNIGNTYLLEKKFDDAIRNYDEAIKLQNNFKDAHIAKGIILLLNEKYSQGWQEFLWGLKRPVEISKNNEIPIWRPKPGNGETVLVYSEQGIGDIIQFSRYLRLIKELDYKIIFVCPQSLSGLYKGNEYLEVIIDSEKPDFQNLEYNYYVPLLSLAGIFNTTTNNIPTCNEILNLRNVANNEFPINAEKINVGFVWAGNPDNGNDHIRSTNLKSFERLFVNNSEVEFYSLQKDSGRDIDVACNKFKNVHNLAPYLRNFLDTAESINKLDLIITVETSVAHLSGTLNKNTWTLLPYLPDWRWLLNRDDSPWYPSMKLFRQEKPGDWNSLFDEVEMEFSNWVLNKKNEVNNARNIHSDLEEQRLIARRLLDENKVEKAKTVLQNIPKSQLTSAIYFDLGYCFHLQNNLPSALENYNKTLELNPTDYNALNNIGIILKDLMRLDDAANSLMLSLKINNNNPIALNNLGIIFDLKGDFKTAVELFQKAIEIHPGYAEAYLNISNCYDTLGETGKALNTINKALEISPDYADAHFNKSLILLKDRRFEEGLNEYEWRLKKKEYHVRNFGRPSLDTKDISGKVILVFDEQGYGDTLNFARYINELKKLGAIVYFECHSALSKLMKNCTGVDAVFERGVFDLKNIEHDYQVPLLSLPKYFNSEFENLPKNVPYIKADEKTNQYWRGWFSEICQSGGRESKVKIGLVWEGKKPLYNIHRASTLKQFSVLTELREFQFFSLQIGDTAIQNQQMMADYNIVDLSGQIKDFNDTAAIINNLDLVISVDTSVAHLAGALGKKVWTLLSYKADWRWFKDTDESPWYPTMKLFRQKKFDDWQELLLRIKIQLQKELTQFLD